MPARATLLDGLRRSGLGVWLAVAYAWAVLALALVPAPALAAFATKDGAVLCSGMPVPEDGTPAPAADLAHCKGCPLNPVLAGPPSGDLPLAGRSVVRLSLQQPIAEGLEHRFAIGLAHSRAPPAA
ncbi:conserved hypothetical protein [Hyphomicrobiales bacterium]|nr:conserved hypothetical protein [Hyphomicrobiales bacterium]CAH1697939.1 conserved hypothetical protein [Hyphomicrobiales bacterium]CAI0347586.1 conserved hypothetical protein [Hyphomicrobiales bacterium]